MTTPIPSQAKVFTPLSFSTKAAADAPNARPLSRRKFIAGSAGVVVAGTIGGVAVKQCAASAAIPATTTPTSVAYTNASLVMCTLYGGNDGLNTLVPYQDPQYLSGRGSLALTSDEIIPLDNEFALHGSLKGFKTLWDSGHLAIVRGVGYPNPDFSHFRSMDIWQSGVPETDVSTGWLGRWMDATNADPLKAISVGNLLPLMMSGERALGAAVPTTPMVLPGDQATIASFSTMSAPTRSEAAVPAAIAQSGADMLRVQNTVTQALAGVPAADSAAGTQTPAQTNEDGNLTGQLDIVRRLITAGVPAKVFGVSMTNYDTHSGEKPTQQRLLTELDQAVTPWVAQMAQDPKGQDCVMVIYSEFGRRVQANASGGTDHGSASVAFVVGPKVKGGYYGDQPSLTNLNNGNLVFTTDFRSIYSTVLSKVIGEDPKVSLNGSFPQLAFI